MPGGLSLGLTLGMSQQGGGAASPPAPVELFPDPTLVDVADGTDGWSFESGLPFMGPLGGTGPGISVNTPFETGGGFAEGGADDNEFNAAISGIPTFSVAVTFAGYSSGSLFVSVGSGPAVEFAPSGNGTITHNVSNGGFDHFSMLSAPAGSSVFNVTHISVTAA